MKRIRNIFSTSKEEKGEFYTTVSQIIGYKPKTIKHFKTAFTHRSMNIRNTNGHIVNYERLEFLGDAMLSAVIALSLIHI